MSVGDVKKCTQGFALRVKWTKTIQFKERHYEVPLPFLRGHPLCPVKALMSLLALHPSLYQGNPLFSLGSVSSVLTQASFASQLQTQLLAAGLPASQYSGHSFRCGGATWAFEAGLPGEVMRQN